jgi:hypothetical protein
MPKNFFCIDDVNTRMKYGQRPSSDGYEVQTDIAVGDLVAGVKAVDVKSELGKDKGIVLGVSVVKVTGAGANEVFRCDAAPHATDAGKLTLTFRSSLSTSTADITAANVVIYGTIIPAVTA